MKVLPWFALLFACTAVPADAHLALTGTPKRPFLSDKYDITRHPNFKYTADADKRNTFDIEAFLSARLKLKPDEVCDVYEVDTKGA